VASLQLASHLFEKVFVRPSTVPQTGAHSCVHMHSATAIVGSAASPHIVLPVPQHGTAALTSGLLAGSSQTNSVMSDSNSSTRLPLARFFFRVSTRAISTASSHVMLEPLKKRTAASAV